MIPETCPMSKSRVLEVASGAGLGDAEAAGADNVFDPGRDAIEQAQPDEEHGHEEYETYDTNGNDPFTRFHWNLLNHESELLRSVAEYTHYITRNWEENQVVI